MSDQLQLLTKVLAGNFIARALLKDYAQVVSKIENCTPEEVQDRVLAEANRIQDKFREESKAIGVE